MPSELPSRSSYRFLTIGNSRWSLSRQYRSLTMYCLRSDLLREWLKHKDLSWSL